MIDKMVFKSVKNFLDFRITCPFCSTSLSISSSVGFKCINENDKEYIEFYLGDMVPDKVYETEMKLLILDVESNNATWFTNHLYIPIEMRRYCEYGHYSYGTRFSIFNNPNGISQIFLHDEIIETKLNHNLIKLKFFYKSSNYSIIPARSVFVKINSLNEESVYSEMVTELFPIGKLFNTPISNLYRKLDTMMCLL